MPISPEQIKSLSYYRPAPDSPEMKFLIGQRKKLGGPLPARHVKSSPIKSSRIKRVSESIGRDRG